MSYAFFDWDKTVVHGDIGPMFGAWLFDRRKDRVSQRHGRKTAAAMKTAMTARMIPYVTWMTIQTTLYKVRAVRRSTVIRNAYRGLKGVPVKDLDDLMEAFVDDYVSPIVYPEVYAEMEDHIAQGRQVVIITTGMQRLVEKCLRFLPEGVKLIGCELEERNGRLTGGIVRGPLFGADKANIVLAYCNASGTDPADCHAYTDHYSDKHMLEAVGHGTCINPAGRLRQLAEHNGWRVWELDDPRMRVEVTA